MTDSARAIHVVQVIPMADCRTERLRVLITVSPYQAVLDVYGLSKEINAALEW